MGRPGVIAHPLVPIAYAHSFYIYAHTSYAHTHIYLYTYTQTFLYIHTCTHTYVHISYIYMHIHPLHTAYTYPFLTHRLFIDFFDGVKGRYGLPHHTLRAPRQMLRYHCAVAAVCAHAHVCIKGGSMCGYLSLCICVCI